ncbi:MAG: hypothetical protein AAGH74_02025 [Pseudomonadota bacterium]
MAEDSPGRKRWYRDEVDRSLLALGLSLLSMLVSIGFSFYAFLGTEQDKRLDRSAEEVGRIYHPAFMVSLTTVLEVYTGFLDQPHDKFDTNRDRMKAFWLSAEMDEEMLIVASRMHAIQNCIRSEYCSTEEAYSQFPIIVYQVLFFMRDVLFLDPDEAKGQVRDGWWLHPDVKDMLARYCAWWEARNGPMPLWSEGNELKRTEGDTLPDPCFPLPPI